MPKRVGTGALKSLAKKLSPCTGAAHDWYWYWGCLWLILGHLSHGTLHHILALVIYFYYNESLASYLSFVSAEAKEKINLMKWFQMPPFILKRPEPHHVSFHALAVRRLMLNLAWKVGTIVFPDSDRISHFLTFNIYSLLWA